MVQYGYATRCMRCRSDGAAGALREVRCTFCAGDNGSRCNLCAPGPCPQCGRFDIDRDRLIVTEEERRLLGDYANLVGCLSCAPADA